MAWFWKRDKKAKEPDKDPGPASMAAFVAGAREEVERQMSDDPAWYAKLPYQGGLGPDEAREFEVEKRALWRRVIADARRSELKGLKWVTRGDDKVCPLCSQMEGKVFMTHELDDLAAHPVHLGCRCELVPQR